MFIINTFGLQIRIDKGRKMMLRIENAYTQYIRILNPNGRKDAIIELSRLYKKERPSAQTARTVVNAGLQILLFNSFG